MARLPTQTMLSLPVEVVNGTRRGPRVWLSAAIHGDELNGMEVIQRALQEVKPHTLRGQIVAVPIVNVFGFIDQDRYLPDRRDLNRCFPGSPRGSLASRLAHLFMSTVVSGSHYGIDLHTGSHHRTNLPQVRGDLADPETRRIAEAFGAPIMIHGDCPQGSLRQAAARRGIPVIVYEAGEPLRFDEEAIAIGVRGVRNVMTDLGMMPKRRRSRTRCVQASRRTWIRARRSGVLQLQIRLGDTVAKGQTLATIRDVFGEEHTDQRSPSDGLVIGHTNNPLVNQGDAIIHLARDVETVRP